MPSSPGPASPEPGPAPGADLTLLFTALAAACDAAVRARLVDAGHDEVRTVHGYVFQHLLAGPVRVTDLAERLGMTAQGASKVVAGMERVGYAVRRADPGDSRVRLVEMTPRGHEVVEAGRVARAAVTAQLLELLGAGADRVVVGLHDLADRTGALRDLMDRKLRP